MSRAVMQQALDVLEAIGGEWGFISKSTVPKRIEVIAALRAELAHIPDAGKMAGPEPEHPLHVKAERESAWQARDTRCGCDHNEYCKKCWPLEFRAGGYWDQREAQAEHNTKEQA